MITPEQLEDFIPEKSIEAIPFMDTFDPIWFQVQGERVSIKQYFGYLSVRDLRISTEDFYGNNDWAEFVIFVPRGLA